MNLNRIPPSFGHVISAGDTLTHKLLLTGAARSMRTRSLRILTTAGAVALLCSTPAAMFAQHHHKNSGTGSQVALSALSCTSSSMKGAGTDACTVTLAKSASSNLAVTLASSSSAVKVPASVTIASGAKSAGFTATASAVTAAQTATLTASDSDNDETCALKLQPATTGTTALALGSSTVAFGSVSLNTPSTQTVKLTSSGTSSVTVSAATIKGTGFTMSGVTTPLTLAAGQTATLDLVFDPTVAGTDTGTVTISSNATSGATSTISLTGTGSSASTAYRVELSWDAPANSSAAVTGYHIYRAPSGSTAYQLLNTAVNTPTTYTDTTVQSGTTYTYEVMSVDAAGAQSAPSNVYAAAIP
jgi:hypothetical protein